MPDEGIFFKNLIFKSEHHEGKRAITTACYQISLVGVFEKTIKCIIAHDARYAADPLSSKHIIGDDNGIVLTKVVGESVGI